MQVSHTSERLTLLVLFAIVGTWFLGRELLKHADTVGSSVILAADAFGAARDTATPEADSRGAARLLVGTPGEGDVEDSTDVNVPGELDSVPTEETQSVSVEPSAVEPSTSVHSPAANPEPVRVRGTIAAGGQPLGARTTWRAIEGQFDPLEIGAKGDGAYAVTLPAPGRYLVRVHPPGLLDDVAALGLALLVDIPPADSIRLPLEIPTGSLVGSLKTADGEPVEDAFLELIPEDCAFGLQLSDPPLRRALSDDQGNFRFNYLAAGNYTVSTSLDLTSNDAGEDRSINLRVTGEVTTVSDGAEASSLLQLPPAEAPAGTVRVLQNGEPAFGATVFLQRKMRADLPARILGITGRDGQLSLPVVAHADDYFLSASATGTATGPVGMDFEAMQIELVLIPARGVNLHTLDADGRALEAKVELLLIEDEPGDLELPCARSNPLDLARSGEATSLSEHQLGPLLPGLYRARAWTKDGLQATHEFRLESGNEPLVIELRLVDADLADADLVERGLIEEE
ncbi:MAG: hypothetical protein ACI8QS_003567 [Planctomycetota bacterium]|jgi:hypothetical protein